MAGGRKQEKRGLRELAESLGYTPAEFTLARMAETARKLKEWKDCIDTGRLHSDFGRAERGMLETQKQAFYAEAVALSQEEERWANYFYPKLRSAEVSGEDGGPVEIVCRWQRPHDE